MNHRLSCSNYRRKGTFARPFAIHPEKALISQGRYGEERPFSIKKKKKERKRRKEKEKKDFQDLKRQHRIGVKEFPLSDTQFPPHIFPPLLFRFSLSDYSFLSVVTERIDKSIKMFSHCPVPQTLDYEDNGRGAGKRRELMLKRITGEFLLRDDEEETWRAKMLSQIYK